MCKRQIDRGPTPPTPSNDNEPKSSLAQWDRSQLSSGLGSCRSFWSVPTAWDWSWWQIAS